MNKLKIIAASQSDIHKFKSLEERILKRQFVKDKILP